MESTSDHFWFRSQDYVYPDNVFAGMNEDEQWSVEGEFVSEGGEQEGGVEEGEGKEQGCREGDLVKDEDLRKNQSISGFQPQRLSSELVKEFSEKSLNGFCNLSSHQKQENVSEKEEKKEFGTFSSRNTTNLISGTKRCYKFRDSLRFLRKFYLKLFKQMNPSLVQQRYVNCSLKKVSESIKLTLQSIFTKEVVTPDLICFCIGILRLKKTRIIRCSPETKQEILCFLDIVKKFSQEKFKNIMMSSSLQTLCRHLIENSRDPRAIQLNEVLP
ncbi:unnamed protein product [Moneuplotes crassus]|uniref:Uncharacterized protein n=1 Tax=Euplotes crassus TaxID=5936 RepID=A0AAD1XGJ3_EUPCR|nr:unnamed protein product [Moneuplotes crassus]